MSSLLSIPSWFSLQDSFEYISQDPQGGKLNTNQNSLGPCRTGSNLGKMRRWSGCSPRAAPGAVLCLTWVGCVWVWVCVLFNLCFFVCVCVCPASPVCSALGLLQACSSKLLQGVSEGGPLRLTRSASFFAGLCGMLSTVCVAPTHSISSAGSRGNTNPSVLL